MRNTVDTLNDQTKCEYIGCDYSFTPSMLMPAHQAQTAVLWEDYQCQLLGRLCQATVRHYFTRVYPSIRGWPGKIIEVLDVNRRGDTLKQLHSDKSHYDKLCRLRGTEPKACLMSTRWVFVTMVFVVVNAGC